MGLMIRWSAPRLLSIDVKEEAIGLGNTVTNSSAEQPASSAARPSQRVDWEDNRCGWTTSLALGLASAAALVVIIVAGAWTLGGKGLADRALTDFAMPIGMLWVSLLVICVAALGRGQKSFAAFVAVLWLTIGVIGNRPVGGQVRQSVEYAPTSNPADTIAEPLDAVVLLGGYAWTNQFDVPELASDGQRLMFVAQLWHAGKTKSIICTGTAHFGDRHPSKLGKQLLASIGVPEQVVFQVPGENTSGEMRGLKAFFADPPAQWVKLADEAGDAKSSGSEIDGRRSRSRFEGTPQGVHAGERGHHFSIGLVTSAYHLPRALRLAKAEGLSFTPLPCQLAGSSDSRFNPQDLIPTAGGAKSFAMGAKEWLAWLVGR